MPGPGNALLVCSSGGHLTQLLALRPWWGLRERVWVTSDGIQSRSALRGEAINWGYFPTTRNVRNLLRNLSLAMKMLAPRSRRPSVIISTGAGLALPFFVVGWILRIPTVYIEVFDRIDSRTLTGRLCRPFSSLFLVQWEEQRRLYPGAVVVGELLGGVRQPGQAAAAGRPRAEAAAGEPQLPRLFVTIGTDHHPFTRLITWVERWLADGGNQRVDAVIQHGATAVTLGPGKVQELDYTGLHDALGGASVVITHGGATAMEARNAGHVPIVVPRRPDLGEHVDGHQLSFARWLRARNLAVVCHTEEELHAALDQAVAAATAIRDCGVATEAGPGLVGHDQPPPGVGKASELIDGMLGTNSRQESRRSCPAGRPSDASLDDAPPEPSEWPGVTVVTPTLGLRPELLEVVLRRIREQDYPGAISCIVVLDRRAGSSSAMNGDAAKVEDERRAELRAAARAIAAAADAQVIDNERTPGLAGSRNTGLLAAHDEFVAFCDDDDTWLPGKLRAQVAALVARPKAAMASCGIEICYGQTVTPRIHPRRIVTYDELLRSRLPSLHSSTFVVRRSVLLNDIGLVSEEIPGSRAEDYELLLRAARHDAVLNTPTPGVRVLWHRNGPAMHTNWPMIARALPWLLDRYPDFRTAPTGYARLAGRIAFASASCGDRATAWLWARRAFRANPRDPRAYITVAVMAGLIKPDAVVDALHKRGRGI
jgi:UDP-N-acetylglucosamine transferase subunit ALG13/glycosyltransferase involved in cell wall biosynthesis